MVKKVKDLKLKLEEKRKKSMEWESCVDISSLPESKKIKINLEEIITFGFVFRLGLAILFVVYLWYVAANSLDVIYAIITAFIISMAVESLITFFTNYLHLHRGVSIILAYVLLFLFLTLGFIILIPFLLSNFSQIVDIVLNKITFWQNQIQTQSTLEFIQSLHLYPYLEQKLLTYASNPTIAEKIKDILTTNVSNILQTLAQSLKGLSWIAFEAVSAFFNAISQILIVFTLAIFFSFEKEKVVYTLATLSQNPRKTALKLKKLYYQLWEWLKGQILLGVFIWLAVYLGLRTLALFGINLENKWTLALIAGLMEFIPYLGPILGSLPALLVGTLSYGFTGFLGVWALFVIVQQVEGWIVPIIMNKALWVSPLLIVISMLFGMKIMGFVGVILAIPFAVIVSLMFEDQLNKNE